MEQVLQSGLFSKAPRLERFFQYICERELEGSGDQIKEYSIAIEALGRSSDFDPKKDSIVRVEAHRLRRRLEHYYKGLGSDHPLRIAIPHGQYRPQFLQQEEAAALAESGESQFGAVDLLPLPAPEAAVTVRAVRAGSRRTWLWPLLLCLIALGVLGAWLARRRGHASVALGTQKEEVWTPPAGGSAVLGSAHLLAGYHGPPLSDAQGRNWTADAYYTGGSSSTIPSGRALEPQSGTFYARFQRAGRFRYDIPLRQCAYEVHLYLAETEYGRGNPKGGGESTRLFNLSVNGKPTLTNIDPVAEAGSPNRVYEKVFKDIYPSQDGKLHLAFDPVTAPAFVNALKIIPSPPGRIHPVRIVAQESPVTDSQGRLWNADEYYFGGHAVVRNTMISNSHEVLYQGERYGNFSYRIPLAPGKYRLTLHFAETWFGTGSPEPAIGSRIFDVFANGVALLRKYDIARDAGGANRSVEKIFENIEPNAQGMLVLDFVPFKNYAEVNAIEIVETG